LIRLEQVARPTREREVGVVINVNEPLTLAVGEEAIRTHAPDHDESLRLFLRKM
jgi:hypothetical protein